MKGIKRVGCLCVLLIGMALVGSAQMDFQKSIVTVYGLIGNKMAKAGTGFVVNLGGKNRIVTSYHVINRTIGIHVWSYSTNLGQLDSVRIVGYDDTLDLAVLDCGKLKGLPAIKLAGFPSGHRALDIEGARIWGNPNTTTIQPAPLHFASPSTDTPGLIRANQIYDTAAQHVFIPTYHFYCISMYTDAYGGASGGPVILNNTAVGVFSGSVNIGGGYAWAIPTYYLKNMSLRHNLANGIDLPDLRSLLNGAKRLSRAVVFKTYDAVATEKYTPLNNVALLLDQHVDNIRQGASRMTALAESISSQLELLRMTPDNGRTAIIRQILDSIAAIRYAEQVQSEEKKAFFRAKRDFDLTGDDLIDTWRSSGVMGVKDSSLISETRELLKSQMQIPEYKSYYYLSLLGELTEFKKGLPVGGPTESELLSNPNMWRQYGGLVSDLNNNLAELVGAIDEEYHTAKIYMDRIFGMTIYNDP